MAEEIRECEGAATTAELALGLLTGVDRAEALAHLAECSSCRAEVEQLADVADCLLLVGPSAEPPPGFESGVLAAMERDLTTTRRAPKWRRLVVPFISAAASALIVLGIGWSLGAASPRQDLSLQAAMVTPSGRNVGEVRLEDGDPPWLLVSVPGWKRWDAEVGQPLDYRLHVELADGTKVEMPDVELSSSGEWGATATFEPSQVRAVSIADASGRVWCRAELHPPD